MGSQYRVSKPSYCNISLNIDSENRKKVNLPILCLKTQLINFCRVFVRYQATSPYKRDFQYFQSQPHLIKVIFSLLINTFLSAFLYPTFCLEYSTLKSYRISESVLIRLGKKFFPIIIDYFWI